MAIASQDVLNIAPELSSTPSDRMTWAVAQANAKLNQAIMGSATDLARAYFAAHLLTVKSTSGTVTSESAGGISRSYNVQGGNPMDLTYYGQEYRRLLRAHAGRVGVVA
jgi:hypothetical protein